MAKNKTVQSVKRYDNCCLVEVHFAERLLWFVCDSVGDPTGVVEAFLHSHPECCVLHMVAGFNSQQCVGINESYVGPGTIDCYLSADHRLKTRAVDIRWKPEPVVGKAE